MDAEQQAKYQGAKRQRNPQGFEAPQFGVRIHVAWVGFAHLAAPAAGWGHGTEVRGGDAVRNRARRRTYRPILWRQFPVDLVTRER